MQGNDKLQRRLAAADERRTKRQRLSGSGGASQQPMLSLPPGAGPAEDDEALFPDDPDSLRVTFVSNASNEVS